MTTTENIYHSSGVVRVSTEESVARIAACSNGEVYD